VRTTRFPSRMNSNDVSVRQTCSFPMLRAEPSTTHRDMMLGSLVLGGLQPARATRGNQSTIGGAPL
jgi:hypothetical protein